MEKIKKIKLYYLILIILSIVYLVMRLINFQDKMTFGMDQGLHLLETYEMVGNKKPRLIGPMVSSKIFMDRGFFIGPQYYYVLAVLEKLFDDNPLRISLFLMLVEFGFVIYFVWWIKKKYGIIEALTVFGLIAFSRYLIIHSRFIWNPHFLLPLGILGLISVDNYIKKNNWRYLALFGFWWGLAFSFHYSAILWGFPALFILIKNKKLWTPHLAIIPIFFVLGDLPYFIFELKHNFYNLKTVWWVMNQANGSGKLESHYFIYPLIIFGLSGGAYLINKIKSNKQKILIGLILIISLCGWQLIYIKDYIPLGHPLGWNYPLAIKIVDKIMEKGCPVNFNVASTVSGDTRSYDLRYLLTARNCLPMGVDDYPKTNKLFLVADPKRNPIDETVWEVKSMGKFQINEEIRYNPLVNYYELEKINESK